MFLFSVVLGVSLIIGAFIIGLVIGQHVGTRSALHAATRELAYVRAVRDGAARRLEGRCARHGPIPILTARCTCRRGAPPPRKPPAA